MHKIDLRKIYSFKPVEPPPAHDALPSGGDIYYECLECATIVVSVPHLPTACGCGNLKGQGGQLEIGDPARLRVMRGKLK
jgi:hypothetical protein